MRKGQPAFQSWSRASCSLLQQKPSADQILESISISIIHLRHTGDKPCWPCSAIHLSCHISAPNPFDAGQCTALQTFNSRSCSWPCDTEIMGDGGPGQIVKLPGRRCDLHRVPVANSNCMEKKIHNLQYSLDGHVMALKPVFLLPGGLATRQSIPLPQKMKLHASDSWSVKNFGLHLLQASLCLGQAAANAAAVVQSTRCAPTLQAEKVKAVRLCHQ